MSETAARARGARIGPARAGRHTRLHGHTRSVRARTRISHACERKQARTGATEGNGGCMSKHVDSVSVRRNWDEPVVMRKGKPSATTEVGREVTD
eukprot:3996087-Pleurochrysis_carterae.AAC.1